MTKEDSLMIKGIGILMMLFLHLFVNQQNVESISHFLYIGDQPLVTYLVKTCTPVPFFIFVSGYGLYYKYHNKIPSLGNTIRRVQKLYISYWVILIIFLPLLCLLYPKVFPGSFYDLFANIVGWSFSYNNALWFLFPYIVLLLLSNAIFYIVDKLGPVYSILLTLFIVFVSTKLYNELASTHAFLRALAPLSHFSMLIAFVSGAIISKLVLKGYKFKINCNKFYIVLSIILLLAIKTVLPYTRYDDIYCILMIYLAIQLNPHNKLISFVNFMGTYSLPIWLFHQYINNYLLHNFLIGLKYPILIYISFVLICIAIAIPLRFATNKVLKLLHL